MKKLYVGCSLQNSSQEFRDGIDRLKAALKKNFSVIEFLGLGKGTVQDVYTYDSQCVRDCDVFLAECSKPSIGLGIEIGIAMQANKRIVAVAEKEASVSRMLQGITYQDFSFHRYTSIDEVVQLMEELV